jgi:leucyl aminopeptidase (aminopeptidase T)
MTRTFLAAALAAATLTFIAGCRKPAPTEPGAPASGTAAPAAASTVAAASGTGAANAPAAAELDQLGARLITNAAVQEGDIVLITGRGQDAALMESIAVAARQAGAFPLIEYSSDNLAKRLFFDVPAKYDSQQNAWSKKLADVVDVIISLDNNTSENLFEGADPKRMAERGKANAGMQQAYLKTGVRSVDIGNNVYPTAWRAERFGMSEADLAKMFWSGVNLDYADLQKRGGEVKGALAAGDEIHVTHPNGTDLTVKVKGRPVLVSDGIISVEDMKAGGASNAVYLPAGVVYTTPVAGTANGKLVNSKAFYRGKPIENLTMEFKDGKMVSMTGSGAGYADMKAEYDAVNDPRKDEFSFVDFGINPNIKLPANSAVGNWVPAGTVTVGTGVNTWAGGDNTVPYGQVVSLPGATVTLDGKPIVEGGALKI